MSTVFANGGVFNSKNLSLFSYTHNNPIRLIDPAGLSPVYDPDGNFLGTDDTGLKGNAVVMSAGNFRQSMSPARAKKQSFVGPLTQEATQKLYSHYDSLPSRPDYDGYVSRDEGVAWAKKRPNNAGTPDDALYFDASKMDFGFTTLKDVKPDPGACKGCSKVNVFTWKNLLFGNKRVRDTAYALGRVNIKMIDRQKGTFRVINNDATRYDWNLGGSLKRRAAIRMERHIQGLGDENGFPLNVYGIGRLNNAGR